MYEVYLNGSQQPVWRYQTWTWLAKRLWRLVALGSLKACTIKVTNFGMVTEVGQVELGKYGYHIEWSSFPKR